MAAKYRVAVIGRTGRGDYGHGLDVVWKSIDGVSVVAVADENEKGRAEAAKRLGVERSYADYRRMIEKERPQIVSVAPRWLDCHREMVIACAEHGCHMLCEKPLARDLQEADAMVAACERAHVKLAIAHQMRYSPVLDRVREVIAAGKLGDVLEMRGRGKEDHRGGGEDLMVLGTHILDLMRWIAGDAKWCFARVLQAGRPIKKVDVREGGEAIGLIAGDEVHAVYGFRGPTMGYFDTYKTSHGAGRRWGLRLYGSKGILTIGGGNAPSFPDVHFIEDPAWAPGANRTKWLRVSSAGLDQPEPLPDTGPQSPGNILIAKDLIHAIETDTQPRGSVYDGRAALEMILATYASQHLNRPATLRLEAREHPLSGI